MLLKGVIYLAFTVMSVGAIYYQTVLQKQAAVDFDPYRIWIFGLLASFGLGVLLGLEHLVDELGKEGQGWRLNWLKLLLVGFPALLAVFSYQLFIRGVLIVHFLLDLPFLQFYSFVLGLALMTSIVRKEPFKA